MAGRDQPILNATIQRGSLALKRALGSLPTSDAVPDSRGAVVRCGVYTHSGVETACASPPPLHTDRVLVKRG